MQKRAAAAAAAAESGRGVFDVVHLVAGAGWRGTDSVIGASLKGLAMACW